MNSWKLSNALREGLDTELIGSGDNRSNPRALSGQPLRRKAQRNEYETLDALDEPNQDDRIGVSENFQRES